VVDYRFYLNIAVEKLRLEKMGWYPQTL